MDKTQLLKEVENSIDEILPLLSTDHLNMLVHIIKKEINTRALMIFAKK